MRRLVTLCLTYNGAVAVATLLALVFGVWGATRAPLDVFPDFVPAQVDIQTEAPGFSSEQVEELVTKKIESSVNGAPGLASIRSESIPGLSVVTISFVDGIDLYNARQGVSEKLSEIAGELPAGVAVPKLSPLVSSTMDLLKIGLVSDKVGPFELHDLATWLIKPKLSAVPGVAHVIVFGGAERQIQIQPDQQKVAAYGFTFAEIADAVRGALALQGAGFVEMSGQRVIVQSPTPAPDLDAIGQTVLAVRNETPILLRDLATVTEAAAIRSGDTLIMGKRGVLLSLASQYGANTLAVTHAVEAAMANITPGLEAQGITVYTRLHRPANFIERALDNLMQALAIAAVLILIVLYLFLRNWRAALIAFLAIPLSLAAAITVLDWFGLTLNTMTLGGFAVALGVLVDDAIIGVENILRRLRENAEAGGPQPRFDVILNAALEVRGPVVYATFVVIAVFLPQLFSTSVQGAFVAPLALAFILAVLASLVVAMTAAPALSALLLTASSAHGDPSWVRSLKRLQGSLIAGAQRSLGVVMASLIAAFAGVMAMTPMLTGTLMPDFREGHFVLQVSSSLPGTSIEQMLALGEQIEADVLKLPYIESIEQQVGRAELSEDTWGPHRSEFHVVLKADAGIDQSAAQEALREILENYPGLQTEVVTFLGDRIGESISGETAQVAIKIYGDDLDVLDHIGEKTARVLDRVRGVVDVQFSRESATPGLSIRLNAQALAANGLKAEDVLDTVHAAYAGTTVGQTYVGTRSIDVVLVLSQAMRSRPDDIARLMIGSPFGPVPLSKVATVTAGEQRYAINHDGGQRLVTVTFNVSGRGLQSAIADARRAVERAVTLPAGVFMEYAGEGAAEEQALLELVMFSALVLVLIVVLLAMTFHWQRHIWLVVLNLPFALIGGVATIALTGIGITLGALVGLITVFGVSARNAILLLAHYEHLVEREGAAWNMETVLRGAQERFVPITMTAAVTALGLAPLAAAAAQAGHEIEGPMAITVLGGLATSTLLNLVVMPVLAWRFGGPLKAHPEMRQTIEETARKREAENTRPLTLSGK